MDINIRKLIKDITGYDYIGKYLIEKTDSENNSELWSLMLFLETSSSPIVFSYEGTEKQFIEFIKKELKARKLEEVDFWTARRGTFDEVNI